MKFINGISFAVHSFCMLMIMMLRQLSAVQQKSILIKRNVICATANCLVPIVRIDTYLHYNKSITAIINLYYLKTSYFIFPYIPSIEPFFMILSANTPFKRLPHM